MQASGIDLALLRVALQHSDTTPNLSDTKVNPEDYEWLRQAVKSFETDAQKIQKLLEIIKGGGEVSEEQRHAAFEELQFLLEDLDNATDFTKLGGLPITLQLIQQTTSEPVRVWALWLLATALQNLPAVQEAALSIGCLEAVVSVLKSSSSPAVKQKALYAIIGLVKENKAAHKKFLEQGGVEQLVALLSHPDPSARMKSAFLLSRLVTSTSSDDVVGIFRELPALAPLVAMVDDPNDDAREKAVELLAQLCDDAAVRAQGNALGLAGVARDRVRTIATEVGEGKRTKEEAQEALGVLVGLLSKIEPKKK